MAPHRDLGQDRRVLHEYLTKGKQIYVEGRIQTREWTDKEGKPAKTTEISADKVVLLAAAAVVEAAGRALHATAAGTRDDSAPSDMAPGRRAERRRYSVLVREAAGWLPPSRTTSKF